MNKNSSNYIYINKFINFVYYSVYAPMISPPHNPTRVQTKASVGVLSAPLVLSPNK